MKYLLSVLLATTSLLASPLMQAEEAAPAAAPNGEAAAENPVSALSELCNTYAEEDGVAADRKASYLKECMASMTDLSDGMQEGLPLVSEENGQAVAAPSSEQVNSSPEKLVQNELVETPDPTAEQLSAGK